LNIEGNITNAPPTTLPPPAGTQGSAGAGQKPVVVPDVVTGKDPSQQAAGERLRTNGAPGSATEKLLGLDWRPTVIGGFPPPPGNAEALKHLSPAMRRATLHALLAKQREQMRKLGRLLQRRDGERDGGGQQEEHEDADLENYLEKIDSRQLTRANREIEQVSRMLGTVERMLAMQDYTLSQMGTFSKG
jgi:hypothetical protein